MRIRLVLISILWLSCFTFAARADTDFIVSDITVNGLQRISPDTAFAVLPISVGDTVDQALIGQSIQRLFQTGNFDDIQVDREANVLIFNVVERPTINAINVSGNKLIDDDLLQQGLTTSGLSEGSVFRRSMLEKTEIELVRQYVAQGRYDASVTATVEPLPRNRVDINLVINEGSTASIDHIDIVGNTAFDTRQLVALFASKRRHWLSWIMRDDKYAREKLAGDLEILRSYYLDRGYIDFSIDSTQVSITPDKQSIYITINITEGEPFTVSAVDFSGHLALPEDQLRPFVVVRSDEGFSQILVTQTEQALMKRLGDDGYAFARVRANLDIDQATHTVAIKFFIDSGERTYVRRIQFSGNERTADHVLRREMRQMESALSSASLIEQSRIRLERLGYFKQVDFQTKPVPGNEEFVDLDVVVEEQLSGDFRASIGYSQDSGLILAGGIEQDNFMGTGNKVAIGINNSSYLKNIYFNYLNPYYTEDGVSRGFSVFYRETNLEEINVANYATKTIGTDVNFGYPLSETQRLGFGLGYAHTNIDASTNAVQQIRSSPRPFSVGSGSGQVDSWYLSTYDSSTGRYTAPEVPVSFNSWTEVPDNYKSDATPNGFLDVHGNSYNDFTVTTNWSQSTLNRGFLPTRGGSQSVSVEVSIPGSDLQFYKLVYNGQRFIPIADDWIVRLRTRLGYGDGYGKDDDLPFFHNFYAGGFGSVRGYKSNTLGPRSTPAVNYLLNNAVLSIDENGQPVDRSSSSSYVLFDVDTTGDGIADTQRFGTVANSGSDPFGGNILLEGGVELLFPLPFVKDRRSLRTAFFFDVGNVYSNQCGVEANCGMIDVKDLRYSVGFGLSWITAFGPLTFSYAFPFNDQAVDQIEQFQFAIGRSF